MVRAGVRAELGNGTSRIDFLRVGDRIAARCDGECIQEDTTLRACRLRLRTSGRTATSWTSGATRSMVRAVLGTNGITAGLLPLPTMRRVRWPRSKPTPCFP